MDDIETELPILTKLILRPKKEVDDSVEELITKHFAPDCRFIHPFFEFHSREEIVRIFEYWQRANLKLVPTIHRILVKDNIAILDLTQNIFLRFYPFHKSFRLIAIFEFQENEEGKKIIVKQEDIYPTRSVIQFLPFLGYFYSKILLPVTSKLSKDILKIFFPKLGKKDLSKKKLQ